MLCNLQSRARRARMTDVTVHSHKPHEACSTKDKVQKIGMLVDRDVEKRGGGGCNSIFVGGCKVLLLFMDVIL